MSLAPFTALSEKFPADDSVYTNLLVGCILDITFIVEALYNDVVSSFHVSQPVESYCWVLRHGRHA